MEQLPGAGRVLPAGDRLHDAVRGAGGRAEHHPPRLQHRVAPQLDAVMCANAAQLAPFEHMSPIKPVPVRHATAILTAETPERHPSVLIAC